MPERRRYMNRDISWLSFNHRVLQEAADSSLPLYERLKFLAIYSSNLDEFFRVRVGAIRSLALIPAQKEQSQALLNDIHDIVGEQLNEFGHIYREDILPELERQGIKIVQGEDFSKAHMSFIRDYFRDEIMYQLQPVLLVKNKIIPFLQNGALYLTVGLFNKTTKTKKGAARGIRYALVKIPSDVISRFVELPPVKGKHYIAFLDDIIRVNLDQIFPGYDIGPSYAIKITRDADIQLEEEEEGDWMEKLKKGLKKRKIGHTARFLYDEAMPPGMLDFLRESFKFRKNELVAGGRYHNFFDFFRFPNPLAPELEAHPPAPLKIPELDAYDSMFDAIKLRDWMLHFPYHSYDYFLRFLNQASFDPKVTEIKATQYRVASDSAIVNALINAARNGKAVTVFVEVKARFDEESNMRFAQQMEAAGVKIIYSMPGLKVHAKVCLVTRKSGNRQGLRQYAFLSTGNFNEKTARVYSDSGFFTAKPEYTQELTKFFRHLESKSKKIRFKKLLVARFNMLPEFDRMIEREIRHAKEGKKAAILIKLNNLEDPAMIDKLYKASQAGVKIDIIVRSICCLIPGKKFSRNITVRRIVDMFLEHARVFVFYNQGHQEVFLSSADWMKRNLYHRIEMAFPITGAELKKEILDIMDLQLNDNVKARILDAELRNLPVDDGKTPLRAQTAIYQYLKEKTL